MHNDQSHNAAQLRLLLLIEALAGNEVFGMRLTDAAAAVKTGAPAVLRDLRALEHAGWAQQLDDGKWRLASKPIQVLNAFQWGLQCAGVRIQDVERNYTRKP
jgi:DNA-binding IclR family transcriptional regulator